MGWDRQQLLYSAREGTEAPLRSRWNILRQRSRIRSPGESPFAAGFWRERRPEIAKQFRSGSALFEALFQACMVYACGDQSEQQTRISSRHSGGRFGDAQIVWSPAHRRSQSQQETTMSAAIGRPDTTEHAPYYGRYVELVPEGDIVETLRAQFEESLEMLRGVSEEKAATRYAPDKWSIKEVLGHVIDG